MSDRSQSSSMGSNDYSDGIHPSLDSPIDDNRSASPATSSDSYFIELIEPREGPSRVAPGAHYEEYTFKARTYTVSGTDDDSHYLFDFKTTDYQPTTAQAREVIHPETIPFSERPSKSRQVKSIEPESEDKTILKAAKSDPHKEVKPPNYLQVLIHHKPDFENPPVKSKKSFSPTKVDPKHHQKIFTVTPVDEIIAESLLAPSSIRGGPSGKNFPRDAASSSCQQGSFTTQSKLGDNDPHYYATIKRKQSPRPAFMDPLEQRVYESVSDFQSLSPQLSMELYVKSRQWPELPSNPTSSFPWISNSLTPTVPRSQSRIQTCLSAVFAACCDNPFLENFRFKHTTGIADEDGDSDQDPAAWIPFDLSDLTLVVENEPKKSRKETSQEPGPSKDPQTD